MNSSTKVALGIATALALAGCSSGSAPTSNSSAGSASTGGLGRDGGSSTTGAGDGGGGSTGSPPTGGSAGTAGFAAGAVCLSDSNCSSQHCGAGGVGHCCLASCPGSDSACGALDCDQSGACLYPQVGFACGVPSCVEGAVAQMACDGHGACTPQAAVACRDHFGCANGLACAGRCTALDGGCANGYFCNTAAEICVPKQTTGYCDADQECASGACLGHACCTAACAGSGTCAAAACDVGTGSCLYPSTAVACGSQTGCSGAQLSALFCDGKGACGTVARTAACADDFACTDGSCPTQCTSNAACLTGEICETSRCCPALAAGKIVFVDPTAGRDEACCGGDGGAGNTWPCNSLSYAMARVTLAQAEGVTLQTVVENTRTANGGMPGPYLWAPTQLDAGEAYPVHLGWGVSLNVGDYGFLSPPFNAAFQVYAYPGESSPGMVTIAGALDAGVPETPAYADIGLLTTGSGANGVLSNIGIQDGIPGHNGLPLRLSQLLLGGGDTALEIGPGSSVILGPEPIRIGGAAYALGNGGQAVTTTGIHCAGSAAAPATLSDDANGEPQILASAHVAGVDVSIGDYCDVKLIQAPQLGDLDNCSIGFTPTEYVDLLVRGASNVTFGSLASVGVVGPLVGSSSGIGGAFIGCSILSGLDLEASPLGVPDVKLDSVAVNYGVCQGAVVNGGTLESAGSSFNGNGAGIVLSNGAVDLSGNFDAAAGPSDLECNQGFVSAQGNVGLLTTPVNSPLPACPLFPLAVGLDLVNLSTTGTIDATNAQLGGWSDCNTGNTGIDQWNCADATLSSCGCTGAAGFGPGPQCRRRAEPLASFSDIPCYESSNVETDLLSLSGNPQPFVLTNVGISTSTSAPRLVGFCN